MSTRLARRAALLGAVALLVAACGGGAEETGPAQRVGELDYDLKLGVVTSFTGDLSSFGEPVDQSARIAVDLIQESLARKGLSNVSIGITSEDAQTNATAGVEAATKLVQTDGVNAIVGAMASTVTIPVAQSVTIPNQVVQISPASTSPAITDLEDEGFVWRTPPSDALQGQVLAQAMGEEFGKDATVNTGTRNDAYGTALVGAFEKAWKGRGGKIGTSVRWNPSAATFDTEAQRLVGGNPDGWLIIDFPETWAKVGPALVRTGRWDPGRTFTADGLRDNTLPDEVGARATNGMRGTAPTSEGAPAGAAFDRVFKQRAKSGVNRQTFDAHAFDAVMLAFLASVKAGSSDPAAIRDHLQDVSAAPGTKYTFERLDEAITALQTGEQIDYEGASGPVDFDSHGDPSAALYEVWQFKDGKLETLRAFRFTAGT